MFEALVAWGTVAGVLVALVVGVAGLLQARGAKRDAMEANKIAQEANALVAEANRVVAAQAAREIERSDVDWEWRLHSDNPGLLIVQNIGKTTAMNVIAQFFLNGVAESNEKAPVDLDGDEELRIEMTELAEARHRAWEAFEIARLSYQPEPPVLHQFRIRVSWNTPLGSPRLLDTGRIQIPLAGFPRRESTD